MLEKIHTSFDLHLFTSSDKEYADVIIKQIDPDCKYFKERWYKSSCKKSENGQCIKDLRVIGVPLNRLVLVDNSCFSFGHQLLNGVPIISFTGSNTDTELMGLQDYLQYLSRISDVRKANLDYFKYPLYFEAHDPDSIFEKVFIPS